LEVYYKESLGITATRETQVCNKDLQRRGGGTRKKSTAGMCRWPISAEGRQIERETRPNATGEKPGQKKAKEKGRVRL